MRFTVGVWLDVAVTWVLVALEVCHTQPETVRGEEKLFCLVIFWFQAWFGDGFKANENDDQTPCSRHPHSNAVK